MSEHDVFSRMKRDILALRLSPGTIFQELEIAERYGSSRTPAREAIKLLIQENLVTTSGRRYVVKQMTPDEVRELYEYREGLEVMSVRLAAERATDVEIAELERHMHAFEAQFVAGPEADPLAALPSFHIAVARLSRNRLLLAELERAFDKIGMLMRILRVESVGAIGEHERIFSAIRRREPAIAEAELRHHIRPVVSWYMRHYGVDAGPAAQVVSFRAGRPA